MPPPDDTHRLRVDDFAYELPAAAIAQVPAEPRDASRLLVLDRAASTAGRPMLQAARFSAIGRWLHHGDLLVVNDSRVMAARLRATRTGGGAAELLLLRALDEGRWEALVRPSRRIPAGARLTLSSGDRVEVGERVGDGTRAVRFERDAVDVMRDAGELPLPPYIRRGTSRGERYQTVYSRPTGSAAAPTAGLHFTAALLDDLHRAGVGIATLTLHVGLDTFRPLDGEFVDDHRIHREWYEVPAATRLAIAAARRGGGRIVAVGTTSARVLETLGRGGRASGWTDLYLTPPQRFAAVDALVTNFHLPRSSLLLLVTAFVQDGMPGASSLAARDTLLAAYHAALAGGFRFFSFGDAMLVV